MAIVLFAMAYGIAFFIARYVFLGQVSAKDWELGRLAIPEGRPVILLCDPAAMTPRIHGAAHLALEPLLGADDPRAALSQALERLTGDRYRGEPILVTDMDSGESALEGVAAKARLLASLSRRRAVLALSRRSFAELAAALEAEHPRSQAVRTLSRAMADSRKGARDRAGLAPTSGSGGRPGGDCRRLRDARLAARSVGAGARAASRLSDIRLQGQARQRAAS